MTAPSTGGSRVPSPPTIGQRVLATAARFFIRLWGGTLRIRELHPERVGSARDLSQGRVLFAFWHGRQFPLVYSWRSRGVAILTSLSRDGTLQSLVLGGLGYRIVRGSSSHGAVRGLVGMIRAMQEGADGAFAVDGPRGPFHEVKHGVLYAARRTGIRIVPITSAARPARRFEKAWDRYLLPLPLARTVVAYGEGLEVPPGSGEAEVERLASVLADRLEALTREADEAVQGR